MSAAGNRPVIPWSAPLNSVLSVRFETECLQPQLVQQEVEFVRQWKYVQKNKNTQEGRQNLDKNNNKQKESRMANKNRSIRLPIARGWRALHPRSAVPESPIATTVPLAPSPPPPSPSFLHLYPLSFCGMGLHDDAQGVWDNKQSLTTWQHDNA